MNRYVIPHDFYFFMAVYRFDDGFLYASKCLEVFEELGIGILSLERNFFLFCFLLLLDLTFLHIPKTVNWEKYIPQGSEQWDVQVAVSKLFEERPIWPKESLIERLPNMGLDFRPGTFRRF